MDGGRPIARRSAGQGGETMPHRFAITALIAACLVVSPATALAADAGWGPAGSPGAPGLGDPYYPLDGNGGYDVGHYALDLGYAPSTDTLTGVATISATAT